MRLFCIVAVAWVPSIIFAGGPSGFPELTAASKECIACHKTEDLSLF